MRATAGTITEYPATSEALAPVEWIKAGDLVVLMLLTDDPETVHGITTAVDDLLHPNEAHIPISDGGGTIYSVVSRYTTTVERFNERLRNLAEHYGQEGIVWTSGPVRRAVTA